MALGEQGAVPALSPLVDAVADVNITDAAALVNQVRRGRVLSTFDPRGGALMVLRGDGFEASLLNATLRVEAFALKSKPPAARGRAVTTTVTNSSRSCLVPTT
jgi:hypothetical protein